MTDIFKLSTAIIDNNDFSDENLKNIFAFFTSRGFNKLIFLYEFDFDINNPSFAVSHLKNIRARIGLIKTQFKITAYVYFKFLFSNALKDNIYLTNMVSRCEKNIFLQIPAFYCDDTLNSTLNYLLYKKKLKPIFIGFDKNIATINCKYLESNIFKSTAGVFTFEFNYLTSGSVVSNSWLRKAILNEIPIIPSFSGNLFCYVGFDKILYNCEAVMPKDFVFDLFRHMKRSEKLLS